MVKYVVDIEVSIYDSLEITDKDIEEYKKYIDPEATEEQIIHEYVIGYLEEIRTSHRDFDEVNYEVFHE